jgi:hypothetical protein
MKNTDRSNQEGRLLLNRKNLLLSAAIALLLVPLVIFTVKAFAGPNGTFPTMLSNLSVASVNSTQMRVQGRYSTIGGRGLGGMKVDIYSVAEGSFSRWATTYTNGNGNFDITTLKTPAGRQIQIVVDGNGTYVNTRNKLTH